MSISKLNLSKQSIQEGPQVSHNHDLKQPLNVLAYVDAKHFIVGQVALCLMDNRISLVYAPDEPVEEYYVQPSGVTGNPRDDVSPWRAFNELIKTIGLKTTPVPEASNHLFEWAGTLSTIPAWEYLPSYGWPAVKNITWLGYPDGYDAREFIEAYYRNSRWDRR